VKEKKEFDVILVVKKTHLIQTHSRTAEEAKQDAENLFEEGHEGVVLSTDVEEADALESAMLTDEDTDDDGSYD
jgi:hypothetical protein